MQNTENTVKKDTKNKHYQISKNNINFSMSDSSGKKSYICQYLSELIGTAILVFMGCGYLCFASDTTGVGCALAFGTTLIICCYVCCRYSGAHLNPAVSLAFLIQKKLSAKDFGFYCLFQIIGAIAGICIICLIGLISPTLKDLQACSLGSNVFGEASKTGITMGGCFIVEFIITLVFVVVFVVVTSDTKYKFIAPIIIGLALVSIYLFALPLSSASANPARSLGPAIMMMFYGQFTPIIQVWIFVFSTMAGGAVAGYLCKFLIK